jgi:hypothetical protein
MLSSDAEAVLALMSATWPREPMPESTVIVWAQAFAESGEEFHDAEQAVRDMGRLVDRMPSLKVMLQATHEERIERLEREAAALPEPNLYQGSMSFSEFLAANPDMAERWRKVEQPSPYGLTLRGLGSRGRRER